MKRVKFWSSLIQDIALFVIGLILALNSLNTQEKRENEYLRLNSKSRCLAEVVEIPVLKNGNIRFILKPLLFKDSVQVIYPSGFLLANTSIQNTLDDFKPGTIVYFESRIKPFTAPKEDYEFNFKNYFLDKGIYSQTKILDNILVIDEYNRKTSLSTIGQSLKFSIVNRLKASELSNDAFAIIAGLLTGYDDEIDKSIKESFSHSGTMHILSVSGLHVGIIYLIVNWCLVILLGEHRFKFLKLLIVSIVLMFFGLITGWHPPVIRAVIMFIVAGIGQLYFHNTTNNQLNLLAFTAFFMLVFDPLLIRNVGFLL
ncbi:MAG: ComEC/Rec2 family competence protein, partial [Flavobacteriales bacterium]|nr:ComEC/Rec2 family competence protein [Flavobacteriales bacterium]